MTETEGAGVWRGGKGKGLFHTNGVIPAALPHLPQEGERGGFADSRDAAPGLGGRPWD